MNVKPVSRIPAIAIVRLVATALLAEAVVLLWTLSFHVFASKRVSGLPGAGYLVIGGAAIETFKFSPYLLLMWMIGAFDSGKRKSARTWFVIVGVSALLAVVAHFISADVQFKAIGYGAIALGFAIFKNFCGNRKIATASA